MPAANALSKKALRLPRRIDGTGCARRLRAGLTRPTRAVDAIQHTLQFPRQHRHARMQSEMNQRRCNLLLVEDQLDLAALMEQALEDGGGRVTHAYSVFDALGLLDTQRFDGAVLDVELRDGVVFPVADRLAELGIPYLFVSAVYDQLVPLRHRRATFVAKPFHIDQLQEAVQQVVGDACAPPATH